MKNRFLTALLTLLAVSSLIVRAENYAWPANYGGVMLQGFYWDSYTDSKWTNLTAQAEELSQYFDLIWIPNSGYCGGGNNMGYAPQYWFTNHKSSFGTETQLLKMIETYKQLGTGIIADVVINHRNGVTNWTDFPVETWNGQTWKIGPEGICRNDEVAYATGQASPTGAYDTGENFDGARDLDHTNANVQNNCKNYCKCLIDKYGYVGFRLDMVKGYSGKYNKIYNEYAKPTFCVGEYFDGSYDAVAAWIESTGKQSAAFDFPCKFAMNRAFDGGNLSDLVWKANGTTDQPAGMIHWWYPQYSVTFVDNHDTYRDSGCKLNTNTMAANAFILCSPGTPCIFLPHWQKYKDQLKTIISIRKAVGVHNQSTVTVLKSSSNCYMAEVTGTKGKLVVKIGSDYVSPSGYSNSDIKATGENYCIWTKVNINSDNTPSKLYLMGHIKEGAWTTNVGIPMTKNGKVFTADDVEITKADDAEHGYFSFVTTLGTTGANSEWDIINASNRYGATSKDLVIKAGTPAAMKTFYGGSDASSAHSWAITPGKYTVTADFSKMTVTLTQSTSADQIIADTETADPVYYTLTGVRIMEPTTPGIYIKVTGQHRHKIIIR